MKKKLAVIDMMYNWPPDGGARVELREVLSRLALHFDVRLIVPRIDCIVHRGRVDDPHPFEISPIPFEAGEFNGPAVVTRFRNALDSFRPDLVFLADGFFLRPWVARALQDYPYFMKFYAYENICLRYNGTFMRGDRSCYRSGLGGLWIDKMYCNLCGLKGVIHAFREGSPGFLQEYMGARAWSPLHWRRTRTMLDGARAILVYNRLLQHILHSKGWESIVVPGGIDSARFPVQPKRRLTGPVRIGLVGRVNDDSKGVTHAIRAMRILRTRGVDAELHITGLPQDTPPVMPGVVFRGWFNRDSISEFYQSVDICLVPSIWQEPFGIVALEVMCSGRPLIATRVGGLQDIVTHGETGLLVAPQSSEDIADAVQRYLDDPEWTATVVENAARHVREHYEWDRVIRDRYLPIIETCLNGPGPAGGPV